MKWFKHMTNAHDDTFIHALIVTHGSNGYRLYFLILELMGLNFNPKTPGILEINWKHIRNKSQMHTKSIKAILNFCEAQNKFYIEYHGDHILIQCPKFKEVVDNWTRNKYGARLASNIAATNKQNFENLQAIRIEEKRYPSSIPGNNMSHGRRGLSHIKDVIKRITGRKKPRDER